MKTLYDYIFDKLLDEVKTKWVVAEPVNTEHKIIETLENLFEVYRIPYTKKNDENFAQIIFTLENGLTLGKIKEIIGKSPDPSTVILSRAHNSTEFDLPWFTLNREQLSKLLHVIEKDDNIKRLTLKMKRQNPDELEHLGATLAKSSIEHINITGSAQSKTSTLGFSLFISTALLLSFTSSFILYHSRKNISKDVETTLGVAMFSLIVLQTFVPFARYFLREKQNNIFEETTEINKWNQFFKLLQDNEISCNLMPNAFAPASSNIQDAPKLQTQNTQTVSTERLYPELHSASASASSANSEKVEQTNTPVKYPFLENIYNELPTAPPEDEIINTINKAPKVPKGEFSAKEISKQNNNKREAVLA